MAQFDVYRNPSPDAKEIPYLLDVQSDLLAGVTTRIVVPLFHTKKFGRPARRLNPIFEIEGHAVVMSTVELAGVLPSALGARVSSLSDRRDEIRDALDFAFQGY
jgi:toxin CcdB